MSKHEQAFTDLEERIILILASYDDCEVAATEAIRMVHEAIWGKDDDV